MAQFISHEEYLRAEVERLTARVQRLERHHLASHGDCPGCTAITPVDKTRVRTGTGDLIDHSLVPAHDRPTRHNVPDADGQQRLPGHDAPEIAFAAIAGPPRIGFGAARKRQRVANQDCPTFELDQLQHLGSQDQLALESGDGFPWQSKAQRLILEVPKEHDWYQFLEDSGLSNRQSASVWAHLRFPFSAPLTIYDTSNNDWPDVHRLASHAEYRARQHARADRGRILTGRALRLDVLVIISACAVLRKLPNVEPQDVYRIVRDFYPKASDGYLRRIIRTGVWLNDLLDRLARNGFGSRTSMLPLLWDRPASYYVDLADKYDASIAMIEATLCRAPYTGALDHYEHPSGISLPYLVFESFHGHLQLAQVCYALKATQPLVEMMHNQYVESSQHFENNFFM